MMDLESKILQKIAPAIDDICGSIKEADRAVKILNSHLGGERYRFVNSGDGVIVVFYRPEPEKGGGVIMDEGGA